MLVNLRTEAGWTREKAEEQLGIPASTLGKWERGQHPPKAADLSRLYLGYIKAGVPADPEWFLDPPAVVRLDPVRARLVELRAEAAAAAAAEAAERARQAAAGTTARRSRRSA
jgi:transcriptional regulator with XRE-family HTH domain